MSLPASRHASRIAIALPLAVALARVAAPAPADWPQFRGPDGQGHASGANPPIRWSEDEQVVWKVPVPGGWSSPVVQGGRVYLSTAKPLEGGGQALGLLCLDARTGGTVWDRELFRQDAAVRIHDKNSHASPTPVAAGDRIFVHFGTHGTACVRPDGEPVWKRTLPYAPQHGNGGSPALVGDVLVIACDGADRQFVVGLDAATGADRWNTPRDTKPAKGFSFCTPLAIDVGGKPQVVCPGSDAVFAYEPASGAEIWRVDYPQGYSVVPRPVHACGLVFVCSGYDRPVLHAIDPTGRGNVSATHVRWKIDRAAPNTPSVLVVGDELYCVSDGGVATCVDARTGREHWRERLGGNFSASPLHAAGRIYFQNEAGEAIVITAGTTFAEVARNQLGDGSARTFASYALDGDDLLVRSESTLYRIGR